MGKDTEKPNFSKEICKYANLVYIIDLLRFPFREWSSFVFLLAAACGSYEQSTSSCRRLINYGLTPFPQGIYCMRFVFEQLLVICFPNADLFHQLILQF